MKQKQLTIGNKTILVLDLPMDARDLEHSKSANWIRFLHNIHPKSNKEDGLMYGQPLLINLPVGDWQLLGFVSEDVAVAMGYKEMKDTGYPFEITTALDQLEDDLQEKGIPTVNPYGEEPPHNYGLLHLYPTGDKLMDASFQDAIQWKTDQSQLWENICLLEKV